MTNNKRFKFYGLIFFFVTLIVVFSFLADPKLAYLIEIIGKKGGLLSSFIAGLFYASYFTGPAATAVIFYLGKVQHPLLIAGVGAFGSVISDYILFRFIRKRASPSIDYLKKKLKLNDNAKKGLRILAPVAAALLIASPLPDELGVAILGAMKFKTKYLLVLSYVCNFLGILTVSYLGSIL